MNKLQAKAIKALDLAISAEKIGSDEECIQAARTAGALARKAGYDLDGVWPAVRSQYPAGVMVPSIVWCPLVDGWHDGV